jgi:hypothetical protein
VQPRMGPIERLVAYARDNAGNLALIGLVVVVELVIVVLTIRAL